MPTAVVNGLSAMVQTVQDLTQTSVEVILDLAAGADAALRA